MPMPNLKEASESDRVPTVCTELGLDHVTENGNGFPYPPPHKRRLQLLLPLTGSEGLSPFPFSSAQTIVNQDKGEVDSKENDGVSCGMEVGLEREMDEIAFAALSSCDEARQPLPAPVTRDDVRKSEKPNGALKERNGVVHRPLVLSQASSSRSSSVVGSGEGTVSVKKGKVAEVVGLTASSSGVRDKKIKIKGKKRAERDEEEDVENDQSSGTAAVGPKHKRLKKTAVSGSNSNSKAGKRATMTTKLKRRGGRAAYDEEGDGIGEPLDAEAKELHATICGMVIETMATSRASSLPVSSIYKLVMNSQPSLKDERTEGEWLGIFERVLRDGEAGRGSGVFAKVESSGKDKADRPLEAQWFYVPERDEDQERALLIRSMMPRPGKRTETMKYKQYYWRPLAKISKWDPEDAL